MVEFGAKRGLSSGRPNHWRGLALGVVFLAIGLAIVGNVLAVQQVRTWTNRLLAQHKQRAGQIASQAIDTVNAKVETALHAAMERFAVGGERPRTRQVEPSPWVDASVVWDGERLRTLAPPTEALDETLEVLRIRLQARASVSLGLGVPLRPEFSHERVGNRPVVVAMLDFSDSATRAHVAGLTILPDVALTDVVRPLVAADGGLEIAPADGPQTIWDQALPGPLRYWIIRPSASLMKEQRETLVAQAGIYVALTTLSVATLLAAMWYLTRVVRREMALAELKANFVADVSHELKTPLALIHLFAETLQSGRVASEEKRREYYGIIARESTRLTSLINNILDFSRIEAGRKEYALTSVDAGAVVREIYDSFCQQLDSSGFSHQLRIDDGLPRILADRGAVAQVLVNLVNNAIKYSDDEKFLLIEAGSDTRRGKRGVLISVHDRGIGIRPEHRALLTEGFFRAPDDRVRERSGTGLGLALVRRIVETHNGSLDVESRLVKGSIFRVFFPAADPAIGPAQDTNVPLTGSSSAPPADQR